MSDFEVTYSDCLVVINSWQKIKRIKNYEHLLGAPVFSKFIEIEPDSKVPLQIDQKDIDAGTDHYKYLCKTYFDMLDLSIDMLGPDLDILVEDLEALGNRHGCFGVQPAFFHTLGVATMYGLRKCAGKDFTDEEEGSWKRVYEFLATNMVTGNQAYWKQQ